VQTIFHKNHFWDCLDAVPDKSQRLGKHIDAGSMTIFNFKHRLESLLYWSIIDEGTVLHMGSECLYTVTHLIQAILQYKLFLVRTYAPSFGTNTKFQSHSWTEIWKQAEILLISAWWLTLPTIGYCLNSRYKVLVGARASQQTPSVAWFVKN